jgi:hypothetical protein
MTVEEARSSFEKFKKEGMSEDEILAVLYLMYQDDKLTEGQLSDLVRILGYELTEEFLNMSEEDKKTKGYEETEEESEKDSKASNVNSEVVEESKYIRTEDKEDGPDESEDEDDDEEQKARKLFGLEQK